MPGNLPEDLALKLRDKYSLKTFIETGTYRADTAIWAAGYFSRVETIENFEPYYRLSMERCEHYDNIRLHYGDSRQELPRVLKWLERPALLWLDAHWSAGRHNRPADCPLLYETLAVSASPLKNVILIDDADRLGVHDGWPSLEDLRLALPAFELEIQGRVVIALPFGNGRNEHP